VSKLLYGTNDLLTERLFTWAAAKIGYGLTASDLRPGYAIGMMDGDTLVGVVFFNCLRGYMADIGIVSTSPKWLTPRVCTHLAEFAFVHLGLRRVNGFIARKNKKARALAERTGFTLEGTMKAAFPTGDDACMYRMLASECRWLRKKHGQHAAAA
jgi:RimJ/RimL family protein N-acetyltransferase